MIDYSEIIKIIPYGKENAITMKAFAAYLGLKEREARHIVQIMREAGIPVLSVPGHPGYYFSDNLNEVKAARLCFECRRETNLRSTKAFERYEYAINNGSSIEEYLETIKKGEKA